MSIRPLILALVLAVPAGAHAQNKLNDGKIELTLKLPAENGGSSFTTPNTDYLARYFNVSRCVCDTDSDTKEYRIEYRWVDPAPTPTPTELLRPWSGEGCNAAMSSTRDAQCLDHPTFTPAELATVKTVDYDARDLMLHDAERAVGCPSAVRAVQHWVVTQTGNEWDGEDLRFKLAADLNADMLAPPIPDELTLVPREGGIVLSWEALSDTTDVQYFQALCSKADGTKVHDEPTHEARYETPTMMCGASYDYALPPATVTNPGTEPTAELPAALAALDEAFVCGEASGTARSITLDELEDGQAYRVVLVSVDRSRNLSGVYVDRPITPKPVTDLWEVIHENDDGVAGGFCVAQVGRGAGGAGGAALIAVATLVAVRRRRRRRGAGRAARLLLLGLVLVPTMAAAQPTYSPYWEADDDDEVGVAEPAWVLGARLGPYVPSIDKNFMAPGPYAQVFKNDSVMFAVDLHRVWQLEFGQVGFGGTAGYYTNSALAFEDGTTPGDPERERADDNLTRLSIVPLHLTATFRATILDDRFGIPVVPYVRGGLAYNVWWIKTPSDEIAEVDGDRARGGTLGVVGAAGLAIRAERIDADATASMRDGGIEHAGFFAEVEVGYVDGFGDKTKLSVGDTTWFGGVAFEF
jgi:hypothetical protein